MEYISVAEARKRTGNRLVLTAHMPGPWGESAKAVLNHHKIEYTAVRQEAMQENDELVEWTGTRNAPNLITDASSPMSGWLDILMYAEQYGAGASLLPKTSRDRALAIGLSAEVCAPFGLGWSRRVLMLESVYGPGDVADDAPQSLRDMCRDYGYSAAAIAPAIERSSDIVASLCNQLKTQVDAGSKYLVGDRLSAADIYVATFTLMLDPPTAEVVPMPEQVRQMWSNCPDAILNAMDPILIDHRDMIWEKHTGIPNNF